MSNIGTGYDLSCTTFSPDGRIFQVEYAGKAVENSGTAVGIKCKDGIVLGVEKLILSKMLESGAGRRIYSIDRHIGLCFAGLTADARQLVNRARSEARQYKNFYQDPIPGQVLADRLAGYVQLHTLYGHIRPFGCSIIVASTDKDGCHLHMIEPSGLGYGYSAASAGKAKQAAKGELDKLKLNELTVKQAVIEVAKIIYFIHDEVKDKEFELELSWICEESGWQHHPVPSALLEEANKAAKAALDADMEEDQ